ncbi:unnamed protein product [Ixodes pacificus]
MSHCLWQFPLVFFIKLFLKFCCLIPKNSPLMFFNIYALILRGQTYGILQHTVLKMCTLVQCQFIEKPAGQCGNSTSDAPFVLWCMHTLVNQSAAVITGQMRQHVV